MQYWPFCSEMAIFEGACSYVPAIVAGLVTIFIIVMFVVAIRNSIKLAGTTGILPPTTEEVDIPDESVGERWLTEHGLEDDTYESILYDYCGFRTNKIPVKILESDLSDGCIAISLTFPGTEVTKIIMVKVDKVDFRFDSLLSDGEVLADIFLDDYSDDEVTVSTDDTPDYDPDEESALVRIDWDLAAKLLQFQLVLTRQTYDKKFPEA